MDEKIRTQAMLDVAKGHRYRELYDEVLKEFFEAKQKETFEAFRAMDTSDQGIMTTIKMYSNALQALEDEFQSVINTGIMAQKALDEEENDG